MLKNIFNKLTDAVPVENEEDILLHHEYDGIQELDNKLPPWWTSLFAICIAFAYGYILYYHTFSLGKLSAEAYEEEMALAEEQVAAHLATQPTIDETTVVAFDDDGHLANGKATFTKNCASCHGPDGQGNAIGPNLTDEFWLHKCGIKNVFKTIKYGVPQKGMIAWQTQLSPLQIQEVASYILTLQGTNPADPKEAQGESCK